MTTNKGNPYHRKGGKGGGQFTKQSDQGITNATDNQKKKRNKPIFPKNGTNKGKPLDSMDIDRAFPDRDSLSVRKGNANSLKIHNRQAKQNVAKKFARPKALPLEKKEIIVGEGASPAVEDNPKIGRSGGARAMHRQGVERKRQEGGAKIQAESRKK